MSIIKDFEKAKVEKDKLLDFIKKKFKSAEVDSSDIPTSIQINGKLVGPLAGNKHTHASLSYMGETIGLDEEAFAIISDYLLDHMGTEGDDEEDDEDEDDEVRPANAKEVMSFQILEHRLEAMTNELKTRTATLKKF